MPDLRRQYRDIDQKAGEIWAEQRISQPIIPKSDRLLAIAAVCSSVQQGLSAAAAAAAARLTLAFVGWQINAIRWPTQLPIAFQEEPND